jgi:hypothetical protein
MSLARYVAALFERALGPIASLFDAAITALIARRSTLHIVMHIPEKEDER